MTGPNGALSVRVNDGNTTDRLVNRYLSGLKFTKIAPGGHKTCQFRLNLPRDAFTDLGPADTCWIYDARNGRTIFGQGYLENPTPVDGAAGQAYDIVAQGGAVLANDETRALVYVDKTLDNWVQDSAGYSGASVETSGVGLRIQVPSGSVIASGASAIARDPEILNATMKLGAFTAEIYGGKVDANYSVVLGTDAPFVVNIGDTTPRLNTAHFTSTKWVGTDFGSSALVQLFLQRTGLATTVGDDTTWAQFDNMSIIGQRMDRNGNLLTGSASLVSASSVLASRVVEDLLGRLLTFCDPNTAQVDVTTYAIDQLAYTDGVKASGVLDDLAVFEPGYLWEILETLDNGKHRFNYRAWPTTPRYVVSIKDGWSQTGGDVDLCNRILVSWTDALGQPQVTPVTAASLGLTGIGLPVDALGTRIKDADPVTLPDGKGSLANATRIGGQILADKINPPLAGTVIVGRPILDLLTGHNVMPWELEPGYLCQVREPGYLLPVTQMDYDDDSVATVLTLGKPVLTTEQRLARLVSTGTTIAA